MTLIWLSIGIFNEKENWGMRAICSFGLMDSAVIQRSLEKTWSALELFMYPDALSRDSQILARAAV